MEDKDDMLESSPALHPDRNLALELVRVTEATAMAAGRWVGNGTGPTARSACRTPRRSDP